MRRSTQPNPRGLSMTLLGIAALAMISIGRASSHGQGRKQGELSNAEIMILRRGCPPVTLSGALAGNFQQASRLATLAFARYVRQAKELQAASSALTKMLTEKKVSWKRIRAQLIAIRLSNRQPAQFCAVMNLLLLDDDYRTKKLVQDWLRTKPTLFNTQQLISIIYRGSGPAKKSAIKLCKARLARLTKPRGKIGPTRTMARIIADRKAKLLSALPHASVLAFHGSDAGHKVLVSYLAYVRSQNFSSDDRSMRAACALAILGHGKAWQ